MRADAAREAEHRKESEAMTTPPAVTLREAMLLDLSVVLSILRSDFPGIDADMIERCWKALRDEINNRRAPTVIDDAAVERALEAERKAQDAYQQECDADGHGPDYALSAKIGMRSALQAALGEGL